MSKPIGILLCGMLALAADRPSRAADVNARPLILRYTEAWNRHDHGGTGASGVHHESAVRLELLSEGRARIEDKGFRKESDLFDDYYKEKATKWSYVWLGTWERKASLMLVDLERTTSRCERVTTDRNNAANTQSETKEKCDTPPQKMQLECRTESIKAGADFVSSESSKQSYEVWSCTPHGEAQRRVGTPAAWLFGKSACIETTNGPFGSGRVYRRCSTDAAAPGAL